MNDNTISNVFNTVDLSIPRIPTYYDLNTNRVARAHSNDRLTCSSSSGGIAHNDCNETLPSNRFVNYASYQYAEILNIAYPKPNIQQYYAMQSPLFNMASFTCDGAFFIYPQNTTIVGRVANCPIDSIAGHRTGIITPSYTYNGCGFDQNINKTILTCNMGLLNKLYRPQYNSSIYSGSHVVNPVNKTIAYYVNLYYDTSNKSNKIILSNINANINVNINAQVNIDGVNYPLALESGTNRTLGNYKTNWFSFMTNCSYYYFNFTINDQIYLYPTIGKYGTFGVGNCIINWIK